MDYRNLTENEIEDLCKKGCECNEWENILVSEGFSPKKIRNTIFNGNIKIGAISQDIIVSRDREYHPGISNSVITDCAIGNDVRINNVNNLKNYEIEDNVIIENVNNLSANNDSSFGIGEKISVLNEAGGREMRLIPNLSSQVAHLIVNYRHDDKLQKELDKLLDGEIEKYKNSKGRIGQSSIILNAKDIHNVNIGDFTIIENTVSLNNGTIISEENDPVKIGNNVVCKNFIVLQGSSIEDSAIIENCFVGQSVKIGKQYSAENSAFFANCELYHGEACSIFAGPYSVSHHKSSLLIAGYFSFYNAGSGTNQSNHMYKLGPVHQGHLERGSKTGSFSYLLFPSKVGAFSVVIGKHFTNFDSSDFPFSYITEEDGKSSLTPALNLFSVGTKRDSDKWKKRDKRKTNDKLDNINFDIYSPFMTSKLFNASQILNKLYEETPKEKKFVLYKGLKLPRLLMKSCRKYYDMGIDVAIGEQLVNKLSEMNDASVKWLFSKLKEQKKKENQKWLDAGGQFISEADMEVIIDTIHEEGFNSIEELNQEFTKFHNSYIDSSWDWFLQFMAGKYPDKLDQPIALIETVLEKWYTNKTKLLNMILKDAEKEFDNNSMIGYGIDGDDDVKEKDFVNVRGSYENNSFVKQINDEIKNCKITFDKMNLILNN